MVPGPRLLQWIAGWFALTTLALWTPWGLAVSLFAIGSALGILVYALLSRDWRKVPKVTRREPEAFALGQWAKLDLVFESTSSKVQRIEVSEDLPPHAEIEGFPLRLVLRPLETRQISYRLRFLRRGDAVLGPPYLRFRGPLGWLEALRRAGPTSTVRVFPDYAPVMRYALLALQGRQAATGVRRRKARGIGAEFHQLREYREGDVITMVDWKATARRTQLIVRDFQEERNQRITFLVDCGQRMRAMDGGVALLDHCLHALLLVAYVGLQQGDRVAIATFGGPQRWIPAVHGVGSLPKVLKSVYDIQATRSVSDMEAGARAVLRREPRRSLVVLLTHLRPEDKADVLRAHAVLCRRHLVLIASLRETQVEELLRKKIESEADAWRYGALCQYVEQRSEMIRELSARGILALDLLPKDLPVALASEYLDVKASGRL